MLGYQTETKGEDDNAAYHLLARDSASSPRVAILSSNMAAVVAALLSYGLIEKVLGIGCSSMLTSSRGPGDRTKDRSQQYSLCATKLLAPSELTCCSRPSSIVHRQLFSDPNQYIHARKHWSAAPPSHTNIEPLMACREYMTYTATEGVRLIRSRKDAAYCYHLFVRGLRLYGP